MKKETVFKIISIVPAVALWQLIASYVNMDMLLASPVQVAQRLAAMWREPEVLSSVAFSVLRIAEGFGIAFAAGTVLGLLAGTRKPAEYLLWPYTVTVKTVPVASFIVLSLMWLDVKQLTVLIAALIAFPMIYTNVLAGVKNTDKNMLEMAKVYRVSFWGKLRCITLPAVKPYLISAASAAMGMAWKAGVAAEVIGMVDGSVGEHLYNAKIYFQNADLLAWTVLIILLSVLMEKTFVLLLKALFRGVERL